LVAFNELKVSSRNQNPPGVGSVNRINSVGPQIRKLRYNKGWSQAQLAVELSLEGLDVRREFVAQIEGQTHGVKDTDIPYFARVLEVRIPDLYPPFPEDCTIGETMAKLLKDRPKVDLLSIVTGALQLIAAKNGK
jgi:transcriptional regulator with XRE-family HTH domain